VTDRPLTILYSFANPLGSSGIGVTAIEQIRGLQQLGHRCIVYCTSAEVRPPGVEVVETLVLGGVRVPHRALGVERAWQIHDRLVARALRRRSGEIDVVHAWPQSCLKTFAAAAAVGVPSFREVPNTHTANAMEVVARAADELGVDLPKGHSHRSDSGRLARELDEYEAADWLLVPSDHVASTFLERGTPPGKLARHRYGCDLERFHPPDPPRTAGGSTRFLFVGRAEPRKGLHFVADVWSEATGGSDARLTIAGRFVPGYDQRVRSLVEDSRVEYVEFSNRVDDLMREADVLVLPSLEEGSALVTYEAQATGCALVVSDATGALCQPGVHGLVHPAGAGVELGEDLARLAHDDDLLRSLQANALQDRSRLSWLEAARSLADHYRRGLETAAR
jgi:glycosyltransferase involved in cell wall biosynthesis